MNKKIPLYIQIFYGIGVSYAIVDQIFSQWVLYYYLPPATAGLEPLLPPLFIALALLISRLIDMVADPLVGYISDRLDTRLGRRIPFIAIGAIPLSLATIAFFYPIKSENGIPTFFFLATVGCLFFIFYTCVAAPYNALIPEITHKRVDRLNLSTWQGVFRLIFTAVAMITPGVLIKLFGGSDTEFGLRMTVITLSIIAAVGIYFPVIFIDEKGYSGGKTYKHSLKDSLGFAFSNRAFIFYLFGFFFYFLGFGIFRGAINYYVEDIMKMGKVEITIASACLFGTAGLCFYPTNLLSRRFGYKRLMQISLIGLSIGALLVSILGKIIPVKFGFLLFAYVGILTAGAGFIFPPAMLSEISSVSAKRSGKQIEGLFFGIQGFFLKMSFLFAIIILPIILVYGEGDSFLKNLINKPESISITGVYGTTYVAAAAFFISFIFYSLYPEELSTDE